MSSRMQYLSYELAKQTISLCDRMIERRVAYPLVNQLLRSATSIGANIAEGQHAQSRPDFLTKVSISAKEAQETLYWIELLRDTKKITDAESAPLIDYTTQLCRMLAATQKTMRTELKRMKDEG